jgi:hypothetical protein
VNLPPVAANICAECPWVRDSEPGHLGPYTAERWLEIAHSDTAIACHKTIIEIDSEGLGDWEDPHMRQCAGAATFRSNVAKKPRDPQVVTLPRDYVDVFANNAEFIEHHKEE